MYFQFDTFVNGYWSHNKGYCEILNVIGPCEQVFKPLKSSVPTKVFSLSIPRNLLFIKSLSYPLLGPNSCSHAICRKLRTSDFVIGAIMSISAVKNDATKRGLQ